MRQVSIILALSLISGLLFISCDSPLSDVEIDDPELINGTFLVESIEEDGRISENAIAILSDKNLGLIHLKNGNVKVNDMNMNYDGFVKFYQLEMQVEPNTQYTFTIELANGESYESSVTSPRNGFGKVSLPGEIGTNEDLLITWDDFSGNEGLKLIYQVNDLESSEWHDVFESSISDDGSYIINNDNMVYPNFKVNFNTSRVKLVRTSEGTVNLNLRGGSITSNFIYSRTIDIIN